MDFMNYFTMLMAATGDSSRPILIAVCLIVSIILMAVLVITGKSAGKHDEDDDDEVE